MAYTTLNSLTTSIRDFFENHAQVNTFHFGYGLSDVNAPKDGTDIVYPYVFAVKQTSRVYQNQVIVPIEFIIMDQCPDVELDTDKTHSDMLEIARDMIAYYSFMAASTSEFFSIDAGPNDSWQTGFFVDRFKDRVAGVSVIVNFRLKMPLSKCYIPTRS